MSDKPSNPPAFRDFPKHQTMTLTVCGRLLAKARYVPAARAWRLRAYGFMWTDLRARQRLLGGRLAMAPYLLVVPSKAEAREMLTGLAMLAQRAKKD